MSDPRTLTSEEVAQIKAIGRNAARGTIYPPWGWSAELSTNTVTLVSTRRKHILRAHHALREAGWPVSIQTPRDPGWNYRNHVPEIVVIENVDYWSWDG